MAQSCGSRPADTSLFRAFLFLLLFTAGCMVGPDKAALARALTAGVHPAVTLPLRTEPPTAGAWPGVGAPSVYGPVMPPLQWAPHSDVEARQLHRIIMRAAMKCPGHWQLICL
ncbi:unnamed protein product [Gadus morhua 'NCC']